MGSHQSGTQAAKPTVVLVALWGVSHFAPMVEVGKRLLGTTSGGRRSLAVDVLVVPSPTGKWEAEIFERIRRDEASGLDIHFHHLQATSPPTGHTGIEEFVSRYVQQYVPHVMAAVSAMRKTVAAVVVDIFCTTLLDAPQVLGVPAYVFLTSSAAMAAVLLRSPSLDEEAGPGVEFEDLDGGLVHLLPGLSPVPASCLPTGLDNRKIPSYDWFLYNGRRYMEADGIMINTIAELEPSVLAAITYGRCTRGIRPPTVYTIGPVVAVAPPTNECHKCLLWLDSQPPASVLFMCLGGGGGYFSTTQQTHCGWNSIVESLWFGVPMLPWPNAAEQHFNAYMLVAEMGVAVAMEVDKKRSNFVYAVELERAVKALMDDGEDAREIRAKSVEMKAACRDAVEEGGSSVVALQALCDALIQGSKEPKKVMTRPGCM